MPKMKLLEPPYHTSTHNHSHKQSLEPFDQGDASNAYNMTSTVASKSLPRLRGMSYGALILRDSFKVLSLARKRTETKYVKVMDGRQEGRLILCFPVR